MHYKYNGLSAFKQRIQRFGGNFAIPFDESNIFRPISARTLQIQCFEEGTKPPAEFNQAERSVYYLCDVFVLMFTVVHIFA